MELTSVLTDAPARRKQIRAKALEGLVKAFPLTLRDKTIELHDPHVVERDFGPNDQKQALLEGSSLHEPVRATLVMKDAAGKEIERVKNFTLLNLPYFTERHTFVLDGNEYQVSNQIRMKPGVYTRKRANEELETSFNLSKGSNFRLSLDAKKGHPYMEYGTTTIPLYPVLRRLGVSHEDIAKAWGRGTAEENQRSFIGKEDQALAKLYGKIIHPAQQVAGSTDDHVAAIHAKFALTSMDPEVNKVTLGHAHDKVTPQAILDASHKLLSVYKSGDDVDDRDSLAFKTFHSVDDFIKERIGLDARTLAMKTKGRAVSKVKLREIMPSSPFSAGIRTFFTGSRLSSIPTQINPMEMVDAAVKVTSLGEGGISSDRAIPIEARQLHPTHLGILDPVRTPECVDAETEVFTSKGWKFFRDVVKSDQLACFMRGQLEFHKPIKLFSSQYTGRMYGVKTGEKAPIEYLVTPNHRVWARPDQGQGYRMAFAEDVHGNTRVFTGRHEPYAGGKQQWFYLSGAHRRSGDHEARKRMAIVDWAEFMGWFLAEGSFTLDHVHPQYQVQISQSEKANPEKCRTLEALFTRLGFKYGRDAVKRTYLIGSRQLTEYVAQFGFCDSKFIPEELFRAPVAAREALWRALLLGDGRFGSQKRASGKEQYGEVLCTTSPQLALDFERLSVGLGRQTTTHVYKDKREKRYLPVYEIRVLQAFEKAAHKYKGHFYTKQYRGRVFCAEVPGGMLLIRRHGSAGIWTGNSFSAGVDIRAAMLTHRDAAGNLYTPVRNIKTGKFDYLSAKEMQHTVIAFPGQKMTGFVDAMKNGSVQHVPASEVHHELYHTAQLYSPTSNLIPMMESIQGNRATMGSKMQTQALPLVDRQVPWVQVGARKLFGGGKDELSSFEKELGKLVVPCAPQAGRVVKIDSQYIYIDPTGKKKVAAETPTPYNVPEPEFLKYAGEPKRQTTIKGIKMKVELEKGDIRRGVNKETGEPWEKEMHAAYGHIPKTRGHDGETVDIYLKEPGFFAEVYCVKQVKKDGTHDEDKLMVGFSSPDEAIECYKKHVPKWCFGSMQTLSWSEFEDYVDDYWHEKAAAEKNEDEGLIKVPYDTNFPFASKTYINHNVVVKVGDHVKEDQHLADSNFTRNGELALGRNMKVGYMAYYGLNSNDAVVISEGAAQKLTSEHMYKEVLEIDQDMTLRRELHRLYYGAKYTSEMYRHLDAEGVIKKGEKVMPHDIVIAAVRKTKLSATDALLGNLKKSLANPYREEIRTWDHDFEGEVIDVFKADKRVVVTIKTREPMRIGDKLAGRYGNKGVISHIVPDARMVQDAHGKPIDILYTSAGVISRINPAQIIETAVAKVAEKTGKPIIMENFTGRDNVQWAKDLLKKHDIQDKETVFDPISGKHIKGVLVGPQYTLRLFKTTDSNFSARGTGAYDVNQQPTKGGDEGAKGIGGMEFNGLVAHNARNVLRETSILKSQKNDAFWRAAQLGLPLPPLKTSFAYDKFEHMIQAAGIRLEKKGSTATLRPLTDHDIMKMSAGEVQNEKLVKAKNLEPERGGLFDPAVTGGPSGTKWSHIELAEPLLNPVFHEPVRRLLGLTNNALDELHAKEGGAALKKRLNQIDVVTRLAQLRTLAKTVAPSKLDDVVKQIKALEALKAAKLQPGDAYVLSKLPVLPPIMRPILPGQSGGELVVGDSNYLYQNAILHNQALQTQITGRLLPPDEHAVLRQNLFNAVGAVIGTQDSDNPKLQKRNVKGFIEHLTGKTTPKSSFFQKKLYKRQQDFSGRGTIAPDGSLGMDEVGIPEEMLWKMFSKFILTRLVRRGFSAVQANEMVEKRHPAARDALMAEIVERPVMVNRAPSLHRYNIVGAYAVPTPGKTIRVNPFIERGMNADYDGDDQHGAVLVQVKNADFDYLSPDWQTPAWRRLRLAGESVTARFREVTGYQLGADIFWCDLAEFPHLADGVVQGHITAYPVPAGIRVLAFDEATNTVSFKNPTQWSVHRDRDVEIVTLASGRQIITDDDPRAVYGIDVKTMEFRRARPRQAAGIFVPVAHDLGKLGAETTLTQIPIPQIRTNTRMYDVAPLNEAFGRLCGTLIGDGWVTSGRQVALAAADDTIVDGFREDLLSIFIDAPNVGKTERIGGDFGKDVRSCRWLVSAYAFADLMAPLMGSGARNKHLPPFFMVAPKAFRLGLLAGLMDTDGSIAISNGKSKPQWMVNFSTVSLRLARELVLLCKSLAVRSRITAAKTPLGDPSWIVTLSTPDLHQLGDLPVACHSKKERFLSFFRGPRPGGGATNAKDVIPTSASIAKKMARLCVSQSSDYVMFNKAIRCGYVTRVLASKLLQQNLACMDDPELRTWVYLVCNESIRWDRVASYEVTGIAETGYDLSVPGCETFMAVDGTVLSNTFQVHTPALTAAVQEVKHMTLSNLLFGDRSKDDLMVAPTMEAVLGMHLATQPGKPGGKIHHFKTKADAVAAYHRGEITLQDHVEIK